MTAAVVVCACWGGRREVVVMTAAVCPCCDGGGGGDDGCRGHVDVGQDSGGGVVIPLVTLIALVVVVMST